MTPDEIFLGKVAKKLNENLERSKSVNAKYRFELIGNSDEIWTIDLTKESDFISKGECENPDCTVIVKPEHLSDIVEKKISAQMAFMTGKLKIKGSMGHALKLGSIL